MLLINYLGGAKLKFRKGANYSCRNHERLLRSFQAFTRTVLVQNSNQQTLKKRDWMMLIINPGPTVNVIVVTINVIDVDQSVYLTTT